MKIKLLSAVITAFALAGCASTPPSAPAPESMSWAETCTTTLENRGGRGANVAGALCECMDRAVDQYNGDRSDIMQVVRDENAFQQLATANRRIVVGCLQRAGG